MFKILDGRNEFYQWDTDRKLIVFDATIDEVHYCNKTDECSLVVKVRDENGLRVADVPNILLQTDWDIRVYGYSGGCFTKQSARFKVNSRTKPTDYVYTETEVKRYEDLEARIKAIEENGGGGGGTPGERGGRFYKANGRPKEEQGNINGLSYSYKADITAMATDVVVGDVLVFGKYAYLLVYVDDTYAYCNLRAEYAGTDGKDGGYFYTIKNTSIFNMGEGEAYKYFVNLQQLYANNPTITEIKIGDVLVYGYYLYPVSYVDEKAAYFINMSDLRGYPTKGVDYWTEADKAELVADVLAALPNGEEVSY